MRRRICGIAILIVSTACSAAKRPVVVDLRAPERLAGADALVRAGCYDCLVSALEEYDALRGVPAVAAQARAGSIRSAVLLAVRERELGLEDSGYLRRAQELAGTQPTPARDATGTQPGQTRDRAESVPSTTLLEIADTLPVRGVARQVSDDVELRRMQEAYRNRDAWTDYLRAHAADDALSAYLWLAFNCAYVADRLAVDDWLNRLMTWRDSPLIAFRAATCGVINRDAFERLLQADPRFVEVNYFLALHAMLAGKIDDAIERLQRAYAWRPRWPAVSIALANAYAALEEFDTAIEYYDRTLELVPAFPDALIGKVRALTYAGRYEAALATVDRLLALERWYIGDARYFRALNEAQLARYDAAWDDIELAAKLLVNAAVPKLAGIIAYHRSQIDVSRAKFEQSRERNGDDCETGFYLGIVLADERVWDRTADVLVETGRCLEAQERTLNAEIDRIRASDVPPARRARQIAKREQQIAAGRRMLAQTWSDVAVAYYSLARKDDARLYAEKVTGDEQFGERARELLTRLR